MGEGLAGDRVIRTDAEAVTIYLPGGQEVTIPRDKTRNVSAHRYYTFNGETIAVRDQRGLGGVTSLVNDHHGTPIVAIPNTTWTAASVRKQYADPFGAARGKDAPATVNDRDANGTPGDRGFLGKSDDTTGLTQVGARYYDSVTGSFISPDPLLEPSEPRQLNAYAYGYQNPATSSDPSGLRVDVNGGGGGGGTVVTNVTPINWGAYFRNVWGIGKSSKPPVRTSRPATTSIPNHVAQKDAAAADRAQAFAQAAARAEAAEQRKINAAREAAAASRAKSRFFKKKRDRHEDEIRTLWHGGKVDPGVAFAEGIMPNGPNSRRGDGTLRDYVWWNRGPFVSTSKSKRQAENFSAKKDKMAPWGLQQHGWVYEIKDPGNGYDVNEIFGKESPFPYEKEIAFKNGVSPIFISGAYEYNGGTWTGNYIPNPRFGG